MSILYLWVSKIYHWVSKIYLQGEHFIPHKKKLCADPFASLSNLVAKSQHIFFQTPKNTNRTPTMQLEKISQNSKVRITNDFSDHSSFENIHSYRVVMSFLAAVDMNFPDLEELDRDEIVDFFNKQVADNPRYLDCKVNYTDFVAAWNVKNPKSDKQYLKNLSEKLLIQSSIKDGKSLITLFSEAEFEDNEIKVLLNPRSMPYLLNAHRTKEGFISPVPLRYFQNFRSTITAKLFERMLRFVDTGQLYFTPERLKEYTGCKSSEYKILKRDVLNKAKKEFEKLDFIELFEITEEYSGTGRGKQVKRIIINYSMPEILKLKKANIEKKGHIEKV